MKKLFHWATCFLVCISVLMFVGKICPCAVAGAMQTRTGEIAFSWSKTLQQSQTFSLLGISASVSVQVNMILTMPVRMSATSNATTAYADSDAWVKVSMATGSAHISGSVAASASIGGTSRSTSQSWSQSFTTPLGSPAQIVFPQFSIPAIDAVIGQVTVDLTPSVSFEGSVSGNAMVEGPCTINGQAMSWTASNSQEVLNATLNEQKDIQIRLSSPVFTITQMEVGAEIGATVKTVLGSKSVDLGHIGLPVPVTVPVDGSPSSLIIAEYMPPTPPTPVISLLTASLNQTEYRYSVKQSVAFSAQGSSAGSGIISDYTWDFGDNSTIAKSQTTTHSYSTVGTYMVRLTVLNSDGLSSNTTKTVFIKEEQHSFALPAVNLYWVLAVVGSVFGVGTVTGVFLRRRGSTARKRTIAASTDAKLVEQEGAQPLISHDYSTGAFCSIDNHPLDGSTEVLRCPKCGALFHEYCLLSMLELRSGCPECGSLLHVEKKTIP